MKLRTKPLEKEDRYRGIVRISENIGIKPKEYVAIFGERTTAAKVWTKKSDENCIWLDEITAKNAGVEIGETVEVERVKPKIARTVVFRGEDLSNHTWLPRLISKDKENLLKIVLVGRVVTAGDIVAVRTPSANTLVLYEVIETNPDDFVVITEKTEVKLQS